MASLSLTYTLTLATAISPPAPYNTQASYFGGFILVLSGGNFVPTTGATNGLLMSAAWDPSRPLPGGQTSLPLSIVSATPTTLTMSIGSFVTTNTSAISSPATGRIIVSIYPNTALPNSTLALSAAYIFSWTQTRSPVSSAPTPATTQPTTNSGPLVFSWTIPVGSSSNNGASITSATAANAASSASASLVSPGGLSYPCAAPTVVSSSLQTSSYRENVTCTLPAYLPANTYSVLVCLAPYGCGAGASLSAPLSVGSVSPASGSYAGGVSVTILGTGFSLNSTEVAVAFGGVPCTITTVNATSLTCITGSYAAYLASATTVTLSVIPSLGGTNTSYAGLTFTNDPSVTPTISAVTPTRGSTMGGTTVTFTASGLPVSAVGLTIVLGATACGNVTLVNSTTVTCITGMPLVKPIGPIPIYLSVGSNGNAAVNATYE